MKYCPSPLVQWEFFWRSVDRQPQEIGYRQSSACALGATNRTESDGYPISFMLSQSGLRIVSKGLGWDRRTYGGNAERFLPTRGGQRVKRFLPIDPFPSPCWCIDIIDDCCSSFMSGESGLWIVSKGSGWDRTTDMLCIDPCRSSRLSHSSSPPHTRDNRPNPVGIPVQQGQAYTAHHSSIAGLCKKNQNISHTTRNHILQDTTYPLRLKKPSLRWLARIGEGQMRLSSQHTVRAFGMVCLPPPPIGGCLPVIGDGTEGHTVATRSVSC